MRELLDASAGMPERDLAVGEALIVDGVSAGPLYVLLDGALQVVKDDAPIARVTEPGTCVGEIAVLLGVSTSASVIAVEPTRVRVIDDVPALLHRRPEVGLVLARILAERLHAMTQFLADLRHQYAGSGTTLELVGDVLHTLTRPPVARQPGSRREPDPRY